MKKVALFIFFVNLFIILLIWLSGSFSILFSSPIYAIARLCGLLSVYLIIIQVTLIGRVRWLERAFGLDSLSKLHHTFGKWGILLIIAHPTLMTISYAAFSGKNIIQQEIDFFLNYPDVNKAMIAATLFVVIVVVSLSIVRLKLKYETWYFIHLLIYVAILLAFGHQLQLGGDFVHQISVYYWYALYIVGIGGFFLYRWGRPLYLLAKHQFFVSRVELDTANTTSIYISGKNLDQFSREAGQFMILRFLDKKRWWQAHPFSLSWSPSHSELRVTVKNSGDFTSELQLIKPGTKVFLDGMYGNFVTRNSRKKRMLFLAGGIGITPIRSLIEEMGESGCEMVLLYANTNEKEIALKKEIETLGKRYNLKVRHILSEKEGHLDEIKLKKYVPDAASREAYICGPTGFMDAMIGILKKLGVKEELIHFEKFSMH